MSLLLASDQEQPLLSKYLGAEAQEKTKTPSVEVQIFNSSTRSTEIGRVPGQPGLHSESQDRQAYIERACLKNNTKSNNNYNKNK